MERIKKATCAKQLLDFVLLTDILRCEDKKLQQQMYSNAMVKAAELGLTLQFRREYEKLGEILRKEEEEEKRIAYEGNSTELETDSKGNVLRTVGNYLKILRNDEFFSTLRFNELTGKGEFEGEVWSDSTNSKAVHYIESVYRLKSERDMEHALNILFKERRYHPIRERIKLLKWDGSSRIEAFLGAFMGTGFTDYTRECSRLIFHCGIARLFSPGCKVDDIVVLQGEQGNGKTTIIQWLCMDDSWYGRVSDIRGNTGIEQIQGKWICEISELLAISGKTANEEAKQYFDRRSDTYRRPYAQYPEDLPRSCIFIGTTNLRQPFRDITGNRRYYPVWCGVERGKVFEYEKPIKYYIEQCWAEAYALWCDGKIRHSVRPEMIEKVTAHQCAALEDDWRTGTIEEYIADKDCVCVLELWEKALGCKDKPTIRQSKELGLIMDSFKDWERCLAVKHFEDYGRQRSWIRNVHKQYELLKENI